MKRFMFWIIVCGLTFAFGSRLSSFWFIPPKHALGPEVVEREMPSVQGNTQPITVSNKPKSPANESKAGKAVRIAEEFIARNGYTDLPPDRNNLSHETVEFAENLDELLKFRHDTIQRRAYGLLRQGRGDSKGWTVVFRHKRCFDDCKDYGRAVTMDENYGNLLLEHKEFMLKYIEKKL